MFVCPNCGEKLESAGTCSRDGTPLVDSRSDPLLGSELGSYRLVRRIGAGGMGQVYLGVQPAIGSRVAIKLLSLELAGDAEQVERFFTEARAVNVIRHEGIVNVLDLSRTAEGRPYIVMEYLDGSPLSALIGAQGALPVVPSLHLALEVLSALDAAHRVGIVHRDIKPDNIFVSPAGRVKLLDFGVAKLRTGHTVAGHGTLSGALMGTPLYMSPEQAMGREADPRSDLYSLGIVLYEMLTGRVPFQATTLYELLGLHVHAYPASPRTWRPDLPESVDWLLRIALQKDAAQRYASAAIMAGAISQVMLALPSDGAAPLCGASSGSGAQTPGQLPSPVGRWVPSPIGVGAGHAVPPATPTRVVHPSRAPVKLHPVRPAVVIASTVALLGVLGGGAWLGWNVLSTLRERRASSLLVEMRGAGPGTVNTASTVERKALIGAVPMLNALDDPHRVDVWQHFTLATQEARRAFADARLVRIDVAGMKSDGTVDVTISGDVATIVLFRWRSPSASIRPPGLPQGAKSTERIYYHLVSAQGLMRYTSDQPDSGEPLIEPPRCQPRAVWAKAVAAGAPKGNFIGNLSYFATAERAATWYVTIGEFSGLVPDDC